MPTMKDSRDEAARNMLLFAAAAQEKDSASDSESDEEDEDNRKQPAVIKQEGARKKPEKDKGVVTPAPVKNFSGNDDDVAPWLLNALQMVAEAPRGSQGEMLRLIHENSPSRTNKKRKAKTKTTGKKNSSRGGVLSAKETVVLMEGGGQQQRQAMIDGPSHISSPLNLKPSYSLPRFNLPYESRMNAYSSNTVISVSKQVAEWDEMKRAAARARKAKSRANQSSEKGMKEKVKARITMAKIRDRERAAVLAHREQAHDRKPAAAANTSEKVPYVASAHSSAYHHQGYPQASSTPPAGSRLAAPVTASSRGTNSYPQALSVPQAPQYRTPARIPLQQRTISRSSSRSISTSSGGTTEGSWERRYNELIEFKRTHGHCEVPQRYAENTSLGTWVNKQRMEQKNRIEGKHSKLNDSRLGRLQAIDFRWAKRKASWGEKFNELLAYKANFGNCHVPTIYKGNIALGRWVSTQRDEYKRYQEGAAKSCMNVDKIRSLESIGFAWFIAL